MNAIERNGYKATAAQVEELAKAHFQSAEQVGQTTTTYLRVLLVAAQGVLGVGRGRAPNAEKQREALDGAHEQFYPAVLRGVGGEGPEAQRRGTFARTAKATLTAYAKQGGDLRKLKAATVTKSGLRVAFAPSEPKDRTERTLQRAERAIVRAIRRTARGDPDQARTMLEEIVTALQAQLNDAVPAAQVVGSRLQRSRAKQPEQRAH